MSLRPSGSGIALALTGGGAAVIHDLGEFARELTENGLAETADVESLRAAAPGAERSARCGGAGQ